MSKDFISTSEIVGESKTFFIITRLWCVKSMVYVCDFHSLKGESRATSCPNGWKFSATHL